jgi:putative polyketide hydroxylase
METEEHVPVLVVGGGLAGLSTAMFLGVHGVPCVLVEQHAGTADQPKARGQSWHTMEALRIAGVDERMREAGYDIDLGMPIVVARSVAGPVLRELLGDRPPDRAHLTPARMAMASQQRAEPILAARARELGARLRFTTRLDQLDQDHCGVTARTTDLATGQRRTLRADHVVAADGWRSPLRSRLGIGTHGRGELGSSVSVVFDADLHELVGGREFALFYIQNPELDGSASFVSTDVPGRWAVFFEYHPERGERPADFTAPRLVATVRAVVGVPDLDVRLVATADTGIAHRIADTLTAGRVHLVGDAAHTMPPHGGQGGNTAVMDGFHLAWKLAYVVRGFAGPELLASHDVERRPYGELVAGQQYANLVARSAPQLADGTEAPLLPFEWFLLGYRCPGGAVLPEPDEDGALTEDPATSTGRPGSRAPHVRLADGRSTVELLGDGFVLLTGSPDWAKAAVEVAARLAVPLRAEVLDDAGWSDRYGIGGEGASLVRPDQFVCWRTRSAADADDLESALRTLLSR